MSLIHNEQAKLTATYFNGLAIAVFAVGALAPVFSYAFGSMAGQPLWAVTATAASCLVASAALHFIARRLLRKLIP
jgi:VIT1/CCC1 family predicted Fe2+/Mn2+ transporter